MESTFCVLLVGYRNKKKKKYESHGRHFVTFDNEKLCSFSIDLINLVS